MSEVDNRTIAVAASSQNGPKPDLKKLGSKVTENIHDDPHVEFAAKLGTFLFFD